MQLSLLYCKTQRLGQCVHHMKLRDVWASSLQGDPGIPGERGVQGERGRAGDSGQIGPLGHKGDPGPPGHLETANLLVSCTFADTTDNKKSIPPPHD